MNFLPQSHIPDKHCSWLLVSIIFFSACKINAPEKQESSGTDSAAQPAAWIRKDSVSSPPLTDHTATGSNEVLSADTGIGIKTGKTQPEELMRFAESLVGIPYVWASSDPEIGFDCSGFITYVFSHFNIGVPRSSIDFLTVGKTIAVANARRGDFILFTGTDPLETNIGHMGLIVSNDTNGLRFIHATSGKAMSVTVTPFNAQYQKRFVRISRIFL